MPTGQTRRCAESDADDFPTVVPKNVQEFVDEFGVTFQIALDARGRARRNYGLVGLPTTVFIDSGGVVKRVHIGPIDREELAKGISAIRSPR